MSGQIGSFCFSCLMGKMKLLRSPDYDGTENSEVMNRKRLKTANTKDIERRSISAVIKLWSGFFFFGISKYVEIQVGPFGDKELLMSVAHSQ